MEELINTQIRDEQLKKLNAASAAAGGTDKPVQAPPADEPKYVYPLRELWRNRNVKARFLIENLIPANVVSIFIGEDGIGKTQILTQLCLSCAYGQETFLDLKLNVLHKSALIIATEDSKEKFTSAVIKQLNYFDSFLTDDSEMVDLDFMEAADFADWKHFCKEVKKVLKSKKYDLVVVDAFSDVFTYTNGDINDNTAARKLLAQFQTWAKTHEVPIIIIHHAAKTKVVALHSDGKKLIEKNSSQGAGAITQKPRTILGLSHDKESESDGTSINWLHVLKANIMSKKYMHEIIECRFNERDLIHQFVTIRTAEEIDKKDAVTAVQQPAYEKTDSGQTKLVTPRNIEMSAHMIIVAAVFEGGKTFATLKELAPVISASYKISDRAAEKEFLPYLIEQGLIKKQGGKYQNSDAIRTKEELGFKNIPEQNINDNDDLPF